MIVSIHLVTLMCDSGVILLNKEQLYTSHTSSLRVNDPSNAIKQFNIQQLHNRHKCSLDVLNKSTLI